jgi:hypothetical protein
VAQFGQDYSNGTCIGVIYFDSVAENLFGDFENEEATITKKAMDFEQFVSLRCKERGIVGILNWKMGKPISKINQFKNQTLFIIWIK